ncbi:MAG TPA: outer membrane beta-barrel protein [Puia sp.]|nr:outer membrane beta-barrel protein [Puia sp.]
MNKNLLLFVATIFILSSSAFAQNSFHEGTNAVNLGLGVGGTVWGGVSIGGSYEYGVTDNIGVGGNLAYSSFSDYDYHYSAVLIGARGSYHFLTTDKMDPYAGADLGYIVLSHSGFNDNYRPHSYSAIAFGIHGGIKYYLSPNVGVFGEIGIASFSILGVGVCFKF